MSEGGVPIWSVSFTHYSDDEYLAGSADSVDTTEPKLFMHEQTAVLYLCRELVEQINDRVATNPKRFHKLLDNEGLLEDFKKIGTDSRGVPIYTLRKSRHTRLARLETIVDVVMVGTNVPYILSWNLTQRTIDTSDPEQPSDSSTDDEKEVGKKKRKASAAKAPPEKERAVSTAVFHSDGSMPLKFGSPGSITVQNGIGVYKHTGGPVHFEFHASARK